jgi:hypothetical protein
VLPHAVRVCVCPADALVRAGMPCRVLALINDSVGCLAASCYHDQATQMGVILGTGTNACIVVPVSRVQHVSSFLEIPRGPQPPHGYTQLNRFSSRLPAQVPHMPGHSSCNLGSCWQHCSVSSGTLVDIAG